jgi:hypothetical protein
MYETECGVTQPAFVKFSNVNGDQYDIALYSSVFSIIGGTRKIIKAVTEMPGLRLRCVSIVVQRMVLGEYSCRGVTVSWLLALFSIFLSQGEKPVKLANELANDKHISHQNRHLGKEVDTAIVS